MARSLDAGRPAFSRPFWPSSNCREPCPWLRRASARGRASSRQVWRRCDGHHEMSDLGAVREPVHDSVESGVMVYGCTGRLAGRRRIMDTSNLGHIAQVQELRDDELDAVSGGP
jgi:hypothetical protein